MVLPTVTCCGLISAFFALHFPTGTEKCVVSNIYFIYHTSRIDYNQPGTLPATISTMKKWAIVTFSLTTAENMYCLGTSNRGSFEAQQSNSNSVLITYFIWKARRGIRHTTSSRLEVRFFVWSYGSGPNLVHSQFVLRVFAESAGVWVILLSATFIVYLFDPNACYVILFLVRPCFRVQTAVLDLCDAPTTQTNPILGISFCMIVIRLQTREKLIVMGSGNARPASYLSNFNAIVKEQDSYTIDSEGVPTELTVPGSQPTADDPTPDITASNV